MGHLRDVHKKFLASHITICEFIMNLKWEFQRVGGTSTISVDIRVLAATQSGFSGCRRKGRLLLELVPLTCGVTH